MKFIFGLVLALAACSATSGGSVSPTVDAQQATCETVAKKFDVLPCKDANGVLFSQPNAKGETFFATCTAAVNNGHHVPLVCLAAASTCEEIFKCK